MRGVYCYLPILRAKEGEFRALGSLSPDARSRLIPMFDVPTAPSDGKTLDAYLAGRAEGIHVNWGPARPVYVDVYDLALDLRTSSGAQPITYLIDLLRMRGSHAIPVTGTEADRDQDYLAAVKAIVARDRRGACLRLAEEDFAETHALGTAVVSVMEQLAIEASELDVVLDFRYVGTRGPQTLRAIALEALQVIHGIGSFRNVVIAGSSVPDWSGKQDQAKIRREPRIDYELWTQIAVAFADRILVAFGDYGVVHAYFVSPDGPVRPPARIRYTTARDHVFYRGKRGEYPEIGKQLVASEDFVGETFCEGDRIFRRRAKQLTKPGNPTSWVAADTRHHLEFVSAQTWRFVKESRLAGRFLLPEPDRRPWLQPELT